MDLVPLLEGVRSLETLSGVVAALGHEPLREAAPGVAGRPGAGSGGAALVVGRAGAFPWFAVAGAEPERLARRVARRLVARGRLGGVLAFDSAGRRLGVAVAFDGAPSLLVDLDRPAAAALACLRRLAGAGPGGALAYAARAADALSGEAVGRRFFREFKATLDRMAEELPTPLRGEERRSVALLQLTRVLFLYFIQSKGWLAGRDRFLSEEVDRCLARRRRIHRDLLRPLFFGTLNRPAAERSRSAGSFGADSVPERRPVRAAPARALASGRHTESHLARCVRPAVRALPLRRLGGQPGRRHRARHARPGLRGRDGAVYEARVGQLLHPGAIGSLHPRRRARGPGGRAARLLRGGGGAEADRPRSRSRRAARRSHRARSRGRLGCVPAGCARAAVLPRGTRRRRLSAWPAPHPSAHASSASTAAPPRCGSRSSGSGWP